MRILTYIIYSLAAVNVVLFSILYYGISRLNEEELEVRQLIWIDLWVDYLVWVFFAAILPILIHYLREKMKDEKHAKLTLVVCGDILPIMLQTVMFGLSVKFLQGVY